VSGDQRNGTRAAGIWTHPFTAERFEAAHAGTLPGLLGIRLTEIGPDFVRAEMPVDERHAQPYGILHGGGSVVLAETVGSFSGAMAAPPGWRVVGVEVNANHLAPAFKGDTVTALCRPLRIGRTLQVWQIELRRASDDTLTCVSRLTTAVQPPREGKPPPGI
jgi:1,4-dihydroxy-2-naphthoyl-CoA hydrolase